MQITTSSRPLYLYVLCRLVAETAAMSFLKAYALTETLPYLVAGFACYTLVTVFLVLSFKYEGIGIVNVLWSAFSVVCVVTAGIVIFGERIGMKEAMGMMLVILGVAILRSGHMTKEPSRGVRKHAKRNPHSRRS